MMRVVYSGAASLVASFVILPMSHLIIEIVTIIISKLVNVAIKTLNFVLWVSISKYYLRGSIILILLIDFRCRCFLSIPQIAECSV